MQARAAVAANLASFAVLGVAGVATNVVISRAWGPELLGAFNQLLSLYIVGAQLAAGGTHLATTRMVPLHEGQPGRQRAIVLAALATAIVLSLVLALATHAGRDALAALFGSELFAAGLAPLALALSMCGTNKVLLACLNAVERHVGFAAVQAARPLIVLVGVVVMWRAGWPGPSIFLLVPLAEVLVLVLGLALAAPSLARAHGGAWRDELGEVRRFAWRAFPAGLIAEANSRIDVLLLGMLASDRVVGLYSFAAMYAEGLAQLPSVIRNAVNARVARLGADPPALRAALPGLVRFGYLFLVPAFAVGAAAYWLIAWWSLAPGDLDIALGVFAIVVGCLALAAGLLPMDLMLGQIGYPGRLSLLRGLLLGFNALGCLALYPILGLYGVALSVGSTYVVFSGAVLLTVRRLTAPAQLSKP